MGVLASTFPAFALRKIFSSDGKIGLGTSASTPVSGGDYDDVDASSAQWSTPETANNVASLHNNGKVYFPEATASYTVNHIHIKNHIGGGTNLILYAIAVDSLTLSVADRVKINKYVAGGNRGVTVSLWEV